LKLEYIGVFTEELRASLADLKDIYSDALSVYEPDTLSAMLFCITGITSHLEMLDSYIEMEGILEDD
jgi:hypothetical protein